MEYKKQLKKTLRQCANDLNRAEYSAAFSAWSSVITYSRRTGKHFGRPVRTQSQLQIMFDNVAASTTLLAVNSAFVLNVLKRSNNITRRYVNDDRNKYAINIAAKASSAAKAGQQRELYTCVRKLSGTKPSRPQCLKLEDGTVAKEPLEIRTMWQQNFVNKLAGTVRSFADILSQNLETQQHKFQQMCDKKVTLSIADVPTQHDVVQLCRTAPNNRGHGNDLLPGEIHRAAPETIGALLHPLYVKSLLRVQEPLTWKGGTISELIKGLLDASKCSSYRDILVSDVSGKRLHSWVRGRVMKVFKRVARRTQHMGVTGLGTDMCHHLSVSWWGYLRSRSLSGAQLFVDVSAAFPSVIRELVYGGEMSDCLIAFVCKSLGLPPDVMHELTELIAQGSYLVRSGLSEHLNAVMADLHTHTWFTTQGVGQPAETELGAKAGDPCADIVFNFLVVRTHEVVEARLVEAGVLTLLPPLPEPLQKFDTSILPYKSDQPFALVDDVFADDSAFFVSHDTPAGAVHKLATVSAIVNDMYLKHGLKVNFSAGKTEAMLYLCGNGTCAVKKRLFYELKAKLPIRQSFLEQDPLAQYDGLKIVAVYKHMGSPETSSNQLRFEAKHRTGEMFGAFRGMRKRVFANAALDTSVRVSLKESLLDTRLFHNACTWETLSRPAQASVRHAYIIPFRVIYGMQNNNDNTHFTNNQVLVQASKPTLEDKLRLLRLAYLPRFLAGATPHLLRLALMQFEYREAWANLIVQDLEWMWLSNDSMHVPMPKPVACPHVLRLWFDFITAAPQSWKTMLRKFRNRFNLPCRVGNIEHGVEVPQEEYVCDLPLCAAKFHTFSALRCHQANIHSQFNPLRYRVNSTKCGCCFKEFHSISRLFRHVAYRNSYCRTHYLMLEPSLNNDQVAEIMKSERENRKARGDKFIPPPAL